MAYYKLNDGLLNINDRERLRFNNDKTVHQLDTLKSNQMAGGVCSGI